jgi:flagellar biosynthetic protein FlhB
MPGEDRSERATPRRRRQARERGQLVRSRELPSALTLLAVVLLLRWAQGDWVPFWRDLLRHLLDATSHGDIASLAPVENWTAWGVLRWTAPPLAMAWCISAFGLLAQGGFVVSPLALELKWARLNPASNISRIFSIGGLSPLLKSLIPLGFIVCLSVTIMKREWLQLIHSSHMGLMAALSWLFGLLYEFAFKGGIILLIWSAVDYGLQRWNYERSLRMSRQEVKDEFKDMEGNPATRGRIRRLQREMRRRTMLRQVARATVVITNPDEFAVALEYVPEKMPAPIVLAKGRDLLAQAIKREARWHEVPIIENPPLAQALYRTVEVGGTIPAKLYAAVAEVLAFIYRAQTRMRSEKAASEEKPKDPQTSKT